MRQDDMAGYKAIGLVQEKGKSKQSIGFCSFLDASCFVPDF